MKNWKLNAIAWIQEIRESGLGFAFVILLILGVAGSLDFIYWDVEVSKNLLAEANGVLAELFLVGIVISMYEYFRRRKAELIDIEKELAQLLMSNTPEGVIRKTQLIDDLITKGRKPNSLKDHNLKKARLNGFDLSGVNMRFTTLTGAAMVNAKLIESDLMAADLSGCILIQADLSGAHLYEANFAGAWLSRTNLTDADVTHADFRGARELTCEQLMSAKNWTQAHRDPALACGVELPADQKTVGQRIREKFQQSGNPFYPYRLAAC